MGAPNRSVMVLAIAVSALVWATAPAASQDRQVVNCDKCHANRDFLTGKGGTTARDSALYVPATLLEGTVHQGLRCVDCHRGFEAGFPHQVSETVVLCETCHAAQGRDWQASIHAVNAAQEGDAPTCIGCHGTHAIYGAKDPRSPTYPLNVAALCGRCHTDARIIGKYFATPAKLQARMAGFQFPKSVHGVALTQAGLVVSATCSDCHGAHKILPASSPDSRVNRANIPATCGACHAGVATIYDASAHGPSYVEHAASGQGHPRPVCTDCHSAHAIAPPSQPAWQLGVVSECGKCHERLYATYFETYHGQVTRLGSDLAARCSDCHTAHDMRPASDPQSSVFAGNLVHTCGRCHPSANANFVEYYAHGDPTERAKYPRLFWPWALMTALLIGVMAFFGLHTVLWVTRVAIDRVRQGPAHDGAER
jgi:bacterioferritin-associated ferredoxin